MIFDLTTASRIRPLKLSAGTAFACPRTTPLAQPLLRVPETTPVSGSVDFQQAARHKSPPKLQDRANNAPITGDEGTQHLKITCILGRHHLECLVTWLPRQNLDRERGSCQKTWRRPVKWLHHALQLQEECQMRVVR